MNLRVTKAQNYIFQLNNNVTALYRLKAAIAFTFFHEQILRQETAVVTNPSLTPCPPPPPPRPPIQFTKYCFLVGARLFVSKVWPNGRSKPSLSLSSVCCSVPDSFCVCLLFVLIYCYQMQILPNILSHVFISRIFCWLYFYIIVSVIVWLKAICLCVIINAKIERGRRRGQREEQGEIAQGAFTV